MTEYRRNHAPGATYFFTIAIAERDKDLLVRHIDLFREAVHQEKERARFNVLAMAVLPDHLHAIWRLPPGDTNYSERWRRIKAGFSKGVPRGENISKSRSDKGERGLWQRRFWEHTIRDELDLQRHIDYVHFNPVKHGHAKCVADWPHSTFHAYVARGAYPLDWGGVTEAGNDEYGE